MTTFEKDGYVQALVWTGGESYAPIFGRVLRVNRKTITVYWLHSEYIQRVNPADITAIPSRVVQDSLA